MESRHGGEKLSNFQDEAEMKLRRWLDTIPIGTFGWRKLVDSRSDQKKPWLVGL